MEWTCPHSVSSSGTEWVPTTSSTSIYTAGEGSLGYAPQETHPCCTYSCPSQNFPSSPSADYLTPSPSVASQSPSYYSSSIPTPQSAASQYRPSSSPPSLPFVGHGQHPTYNHNQPSSAHTSAGHSIPGYLTQGYVSHTFGHPTAQSFWTAVLKCAPESLQTLYYGGPSPYWQIGPRTTPAGVVPAVTLDYMVYTGNNTGPVIPQRLWSPLYRRIREVVVDNSPLCMPIFFVHHETQRVGIALTEALAKKHYVLHGDGHAVDLGGKVTTHIRVLWKGYHEFKRQIQIQDQTRERNPIILGKLVEHVARTVQRFLTQPPPTIEDEYDTRWRVGSGGIQVNDVVLVGVVHTSAGSWQPLLRLSRPLPSPANQGAARPPT